MLDESRHADEALPSTRNLVAGLFGLENSRTTDDVRRVLGQLLVWLAEPEQLQLRRHFTVWLKRVLLPSRMRGINFDQLHDLQEIDNMLAERVKDWTRDWREQGIEEGRKKGIEEGRQEGERAMLIRLLSRRFGTLDEETLQRLADASSAELESWAERILNATSLEDVFRGE
ncbi:DUF4351 domain-containing protein [Pseudomonas lopnurensis]|uniref:DUF4351 domain-containing protein n=1 Tax=Pseudomonas lopnurensis TaxID=1477517 RepID=UPI0028AF6FA2|nr:DUF4351 domain-containing protein [Pseudomonas lopnurensis]